MMRAIFVHGAGGGAWQWQIWSRLFRAAHWDVECLQLEPRTQLSATRLLDYRAQVKHAIEANERDCVVIGASMGAALALDVESADRLRARIAINPPLDSSRLKHKYQQESGVKAWSKSPASSTWQAMQSDFFTRQFSHRHWRDESIAVLQDLAVWQPPKRPGEATLVVHGTEDEGAPMDAVRDLQQRWQCGTINVPAAGHLEPVLAPPAINCARRTVGWLNATIGT